jgi:hypothetical protein
VIHLQLDYHPGSEDRLAWDVETFAASWLNLWASLTCLENFSSDLRHRVLLDLINEPDKLGGEGIKWVR